MLIPSRRRLKDNLGSGRITNIVMDNRFVIKQNQMRQRKLSAELENIHARLEGSLYLIEHEVNVIKKDQDKQTEPEPEIDLSYFKRKTEFNAMESSRRRASSFSTTESKTSNDSPQKPSIVDLRAKRTHKIESPIAEYIASPIPSFARARRMSLPANLVHSFEPFSVFHGKKGSNDSINKGSNSNLKGSHGDVRRSRDKITRSRDTSPEMEKYENQMRRLKRELDQRKPKTIKQLERIPLTSTEETHIINYLQEEEHKRETEKKNAELLDGLKKCTYLRTNNPTELSVEEMLDRTPN